MVRPERRAALRDAIADLLRYRTGLTESAFLAARDTQRMVLHAMYVAIQAALDDALELFYPIVDLSRVFAALAELDDLERFARWIDGGASGA